VSDTPQSQELTNLLQTFGVQYPSAPAPTPALLAFLRGLGLTMQTAADLKNKAIARIGSATNDAMADIDRGAGRSKQNVTADLIRRGVLSSGEANTRYARQAEDVATSKRDLLRSQSTATSDAQSTYAQQSDTARMQALDRVIAAEQDQATAAATSKAQTDAFAQQQTLLDQQWQREQAAQTSAQQAQIDAINRAASQGVAV
jgi:accessory colonization factor AcfC